MNFPKRYLADGTATTRRVVSVELTNEEPRTYSVLTAWAGNHSPEDLGWRVTVLDDGSFDLRGLPERETPQTRAGIVRRIRAAEARRTA